MPVTVLPYFKTQIAAMMEENEKLDTIAKLDEQEFCLDAEELERLHDECEEEVSKVGKCLTRAPKDGTKEQDKAKQNKHPHDAVKASSHGTFPKFSSLVETPALALGLLKRITDSQRHKPR